VRVSHIVKVDVEIERLVRTVASKLGYNAFTIRNLAILLGLSEMLRLSRVWKLKLNDEVMWKAFDEVKKEVEAYVKT